MLLVSISMTVIIGKIVNKSNTEQIQKSIITETEKKADDVEIQLSGMVYSAETLAGNLGGVWPIPEKYRRTAAEQIVRALIKNSTLDSAWGYWLPGMFDFRDAEKIDVDNNPTGQK